MQWKVFPVCLAHIPDTCGRAINSGCEMQASSKWQSAAQTARQWRPSAEHMRANATPASNAMAGKAIGVPMTLAFCGAALACSMGLFYYAWHQHQVMYPFSREEAIMHVATSKGVAAERMQEMVRVNAADRRRAQQQQAKPDA